MSKKYLSRRDFMKHVSALGAVPFIGKIVKWFPEITQISDLSQFIEHRELNGESLRTAIDSAIETEEGQSLLEFLRNRGYETIAYNDSFGYEIHVDDGEYREDVTSLNISFTNSTGRNHSSVVILITSQGVKAAGVGFLQVKNSRQRAFEYYELVDGALEEKRVEYEQLVDGHGRIIFSDGTQKIIENTAFSTCSTCQDVCSTIVTTVGCSVGSVFACALICAGTLGLGCLICAAVFGIVCGLTGTYSSCPLACNILYGCPV